MSKINLELTIEEVNTILSGLGNLPFVQVNKLIINIQQQSQSQLQQEEIKKEKK